MLGIHILEGVLSRKLPQTRYKRWLAHVLRSLVAFRKFTGGFGGVGGYRKEVELLATDHASIESRERPQTYQVEATSCAPVGSGSRLMARMGMYIEWKCTR